MRQKRLKERKMTRTAPSQELFFTNFPTLCSFILSINFTSRDKVFDFWKVLTGVKVSIDCYAKSCKMFDFFFLFQISTEGWGSSKWKPYKVFQGVGSMKMIARTKKRRDQETPFYAVTFPVSSTHSGCPNSRQSSWAIRRWRKNGKERVGRRLDPEQSSSPRSPQTRLQKNMLDNERKQQQGSKPHRTRKLCFRIRL